MGIGNTLKRAISRFAPSVFVISGPTVSPWAVAITFDDGPHPVNTPRILDTLAAHDAKATFFLQGNMAEQNPELVREIVSRGHQIGNHGYAHRDAKVVSTDEYVADVLRAQKALEHIVGSELPRIFRPPFGNIAAGSLIALLRRGFCFIFWSHDSRDSYLPDARTLFDYISVQSISAGSILLFHDDYAHTTEILPKILAHLQKCGLQVTSVAELLSKLPSKPNFA